VCKYKDNGTKAAASNFEPRRQLCPPSRAVDCVLTIDLTDACADTRIGAHAISHAPY